MDMPSQAYTKLQNRSGQVNSHIKTAACKGGSPVPPLDAIGMGVAALQAAVKHKIMACRNLGTIFSFDKQGTREMQLFFHDLKNHCKRNEGIYIRCFTPLAVKHMHILA